MALGDYLSSKAESDFIESERKRESWEIENYIEGEKKELADIYEVIKSFYIRPKD